MDVNPSLISAEQWMSPPRDCGMDSNRNTPNKLRNNNSLYLLALQYGSPEPDRMNNFIERACAKPKSLSELMPSVRGIENDGKEEPIDEFEIQEDMQLCEDDVLSDHSEFDPNDYDVDSEEYDSASSDATITCRVRSPLPSDEEFLLLDELQVKPASQKNPDIEVAKRIKKTIMSNKNRIRRRIFCPFYDTDVTNFARHVIRNHKNEPDVQAFAWRPTKDPERRRALELLWKQGNFLKSSEGDVRPVRTPQVPRSNENYTTCTKCYGNFVSSTFYKHAKICHFNKDGTNSKKPRYYHQIAGQNLLIRHLKVDENLRAQVFPRMRPDQVSLVAKSDGLIMKFGARYLNSHRAAHFIPVTSRKMRELAKVLIAVKAIAPEVKTFLDLLQPRHFANIVTATKQIAKFDPKTKTYQSPTFALNISTSIKECCDLAVLDLINRKELSGSVSTAEVTSEIKSLRDIIEKHWKYEVSTQAGNDLREKSWNKVTLIPVAADLAHFKSYLIQEGSKLESTLEKNPNAAEAFYGLVEIVYCRLLLLNRRRPGELQRLTVDLFTNHIDRPRPNASEEFSEVISPTERILFTKFRRIVLRGKRGRGVPIFFCSDVYKHAKMIVALREKFVVGENRIFFSRKDSDEPLRGYQVLAKHVKKSGVKYPEAITCTKLRKHLATMSQLFSMNSTDIEQLATFMGHTVGVHKNVYRLPDDVYQTAKIAKLLVLMEKGHAGKYKNKSLDEIDIRPDEEVDNYPNDDLEAAIETTLDDGAICNELAPEPSARAEAIFNEQEPQAYASRPPLAGNHEQQVSGDEDAFSIQGQINDFAEIFSPQCDDALPPSPPATTKTKRRNLVPWTEAQKSAAKKFFASHIRSKRPPKRLEVEELVSKTGGLFHNKSWQVIKVFVQNAYTKK